MKYWIGDKLGEQKVTEVMVEQKITNNIIISVKVASVVRQVNISGGIKL